MQQLKICLLLRCCCCQVKCGSKTSKLNMIFSHLSHGLLYLRSYTIVFTQFIPDGFQAYQAGDVRTVERDGQFVTEQIKLCCSQWAGEKNTNKVSVNPWQVFNKASLISAGVCFVKQERFSWSPKRRQALPNLLNFHLLSVKSTFEWVYSLEKPRAAMRLNWTVFFLSPTCNVPTPDPHQSVSRFKHSSCYLCYSPFMLSNLSKIKGALWVMPSAN